MRSTRRSGFVRVNSILPACTTVQYGDQLFLLTNRQRDRRECTEKGLYSFALTVPLKALEIALIGKAANNQSARLFLKIGLDQFERSNGFLTHALQRVTGVSRVSCIVVRYRFQRGGDSIDEVAGWLPVVRCRLDFGPQLVVLVLQYREIIRHCLRLTPFAYA